jgi:hypothetical protein
MTRMRRNGSVSCWVGNAIHPAAYAAGSPYPRHPRSYFEGDTAFRLVPGKKGRNLLW